MLEKRLRSRPVGLRDGLAVVLLASLATKIPNGYITALAVEYEESFAN